MSPSAAPPAGSSAAQRNWFETIAQRPVRILVIQRDNIGDLVLITPFLEALRSCLPDARIEALVNSYNAPVLDGNRNLDGTHVYVKAKHRDAGTSLARLYASRAALWLALRRARYDLAVLMTGRFAKSSLRPARAAGARHVAGYTDGSVAARRVDLGVDGARLDAKHVVARSRALLEVVVPDTRLGPWRSGPLPPCHVSPDAARRSRLAGRCEAALGGRPGLLVGVHISARKIDQRWPAERFVALMHQLHEARRCAFVLLWAPGRSDNALHPGDDEKAEAIISRTSGIPVWACPTATLAELIAALDFADLLVCSDGGAMHVAAGLDCPIVALFGNSDPAVWHPWGPRYHALREPSERAADIEVGRVADSCLDLLGPVRGTP